ncbi:MAG: DUF1273 domain-containing protein [Oscillospiraceae bacterium]|nr:DUF1273 domain-containing protein [Oscillospiraceae bacterium]
MKTCGITGHRRIAECKIEFVKRELRREVELAISEGHLTFLSGFAEGIDLEFAELISEMRENNPDIFFEAVIPYRDRLNAKSPKFHKFLGKCDKITVTSEKYSSKCYQVRNTYLVEKSDRIIAVFDGRNRSGTAQTIRIARKKKREIRFIMI